MIETHEHARQLPGGGVLAIRTLPESGVDLGVFFGLVFSQGPPKTPPPPIPIALDPKANVFSFLHPPPYFVAYEEDEALERERGEERKIRYPVGATSLQTRLGPRRLLPGPLLHLTCLLAMWQETTPAAAARQQAPSGNTAGEVCTWAL